MKRHLLFLFCNALVMLFAARGHAQVPVINKILCPDSAYVGTQFEIKYVSDMPDLGLNVDGDRTFPWAWVEFQKIPKGTMPIWVYMPKQVLKGGWILVGLAYYDPKAFLGYTIIPQIEASCKVFAMLPITTGILKPKKFFKKDQDGFALRTHNLKGQYVPTK